MRPVRLVIVDDRPVVRRGLCHVLADAEDVEVVGEASDGEQALGQVATERPDVLLLDVRMRGMDGLRLLRRLEARRPDLKVVVLTSYDDEELLLEAFRAGAYGYLLETAGRREILRALRMVHEGKRTLSPELMDRVLSRFAELSRGYARERFGLSETEVELLRRIAEGDTNDEIAHGMRWSVSTVKRKLSDVFGKLGVEDRTQAAAEAVRQGLI